MPRRSHLPHDLVRELHAAVISAGLSRADLLASLERRLVASLRTTSSPSAQILHDLSALNDIPSLLDGSVPLRAWLETALHLAGMRPESAVFERALRAMNANAPAAPTAPAAPPLVQQPTSATSTAMQTADILIVTVLPEEYAAVLGQLTEPRLAEGTAESPNTYAWRIGTLPREAAGGSGAPSHGPRTAYRVALALIGGAGNVHASQAVSESVKRWQPRYVLLVGIAGGLAQGGCAVGDVVVSTEIYGYEYGKLDGGFKPRPNWTYQVDSGLRASAQGFSVANPGWTAGLSGARPKVLFGPVAAGDKVMDDPADALFAAVLQLWPKLQAVEMESAGAAAAIEHLRARSTVVGFLTVRGISDMPRPPTERPDHETQRAERDTHKQRACEAAARFVSRWIASEWPAAPSEPPNPPQPRQT